MKTIATLVLFLVGDAVQAAGELLRGSKQANRQLFVGKDGNRQLLVDEEGNCSYYYDPYGVKTCLRIGQPLFTCDGDLYAIAQPLGCADIYCPNGNKWRDDPQCNL